MTLKLEASGGAPEVEGHAQGQPCGAQPRLQTPRAHSLDLLL